MGIYSYLMRILKLFGVGVARQSKATYDFYLFFLFCFLFFFYLICSRHHIDSEVACFFFFNLLGMTLKSDGEDRYIRRDRFILVTVR